LGCLDLNAYIPVIGHALIDSLKLLISCDETLNTNLMKGLVMSAAESEADLLSSPAITTALLPYIGYHKSALLAREMKEKQVNIIEANKSLKMLPADKLRHILEPENLLKEGFTLNDIIHNHG
jgi:aspartate ammonia-lyase